MQDGLHERRECHLDLEMPLSLLSARCRPLYHELLQDTLTSVVLISVSRSVLAAVAVTLWSSLLLL